MDGYKLAISAGVSIVVGAFVMAFYGFESNRAACGSVLGPVIEAPPECSGLLSIARLVAIVLACVGAGLIVGGVVSRRRRS